MDPGTTTDAQPAQESSEPPAAPSPLPSPPLPQPGDAWVQPPKLAGQLSPGWRLAFALGWGMIIAGTAAVWEASRVIGLSTWWLGPDAEPRFLVFQLLPFYGPIIVLIAAISNWRYAPYLGIAVALLGAAIGAGDLNRVRWIAVVELVLAGGALCISIASLAGMYRPARPAQAA
jgi:hypothetical protein